MNKVVHLMRWFLPFTASFIRNQILYHEKYRPSVVFAQKSEGAFYEEITGKYEAFYPFSRSRVEEQLYRRFRVLGPAAKNGIRKFIQEAGPDVLHVHYGVDCLVYAGIVRELPIPTCVSFYGYDCSSFPERFNGYGKNLLRKHVFHNPGVDAVLAMTEDMKKDLIDLGCPEHKIIVHYYGTETKPFYIQQHYPEKEVIDLLIISSFQERKGHDFLIDAFQQLSRSSRHQVRLHIVGEGYLRDEIRRKIAHTGLDNIFLHGPVKYGSEEHLEYFRMADIFVHPSVMPPDGEKEGIPGAIIEAMAAGLPVISTHHAGIPFIIEDKRTGLLVKEYDVTGLKNAMEQLVRNRDYRTSVAMEGQKYAVNYLDVQEKEKELEQIYDALVHKNRASSAVRRS